VDGVNKRFDFTVPAPALADLGRVHLIAIGGAGMSAVARLLLARGVPVSGSDAKDSAALRSLAAQGATTWVGHDPSHVDGADSIVISSAIREANVELARARALGLPVWHRAQALAATMAGHRRLAVAGANGKTTTTSMLTVALATAGADLSFAAGSELADLGTNAAWHPGTPFVVEADESDGSFLAYHPDVAVVTNVQPDHLDFYGTFARVQAAYAAFAETVPAEGLLVVCADDPGAMELAAAMAGRRRVLTYGRAPGADLRVRSSRLGADGSTSLVRDRSGTERTLILSTPGAHNVLNAGAAYLAAVEGTGADPEAVLAGLARYGGAARRFERHGEVDGVSVVDDYAHNPAKVSAVVETAADIAHARGGRLLVVFQPHLYSRTRDFADGFARGLAPADEVVLLDVYGAREDPLPGVGSELIVAKLAALGRYAVVLGAAEAVDQAARWSRPADLVLTVGAGDVTELAPRIVAALRERA